MKIKLAVFVFLSLILSSYANRVLWVGFTDDPMIDVNGIMTPLETWINSLPCDPIDVSGRIRVNNDPMPAGWETSSGGINVEFYDEQTDFGVLKVVGTEDPEVYEVAEPWSYSDWQPIRLDNTDLDATVFFDLGYLDENWDFVQVATTSATLGDLWDSHSYETFDIGPPISTPWRPYAAVPEPASAILAVFGAGLLLKRRRS